MARTVKNGEGPASGKILFSPNVQTGPVSFAERSPGTLRITRQTMLRLHRSFSCSCKSLQQASASLAREQIDAYVQYFRTPKDLRPLVYREKNASHLLSRDLWDEVAKKRVVPLEPPTVPSKSALIKIISECTDGEELKESRDLLLELSKKPNYTSPDHIDAFLEKSAQLRKFPHALTFIYSQPSLRQRLDSHNLNTILVYLYINDRKSLLNSVSKAQVALDKIRKPNVITDLLRASLYLKHNEQVPADLKEKITSSTETVSIPQLSLDKSIGALSRDYNTYRNKYLELAPIAIEASKDEALASLQTVKDITQFAQSFKQLQDKIQLKDAFSVLKSKSIFRRPKQPSQEGKTAEEETKEE